MKNIENALVILAGGNGSRFGKKLPKQFTQINGENLIHFFLKRLDTDNFCLLYTSPSPRDRQKSRMPSSA